ncbi:hypothetical protein BKA62DRAFT_715094, partial [Auriculariales sp. MPI-PUGE-AT-0066]
AKCMTVVADTGTHGRLSVMCWVITLLLLLLGWLGALKLAKGERVDVRMTHRIRTRVVKSAIEMAKRPVRAGRIVVSVRRQGRRIRARAHGAHIRIPRKRRTREPRM